MATPYIQEADGPLSVEFESGYQPNGSGLMTTTSITDDEEHDWIEQRRPRVGLGGAGQLQGRKLLIEPDEQDPNAWHIYVPQTGWDIWFDHGDDLRGSLAKFKVTLGVR